MKTNAKLNAACTRGGAQTVMDTIEYNFNIIIDHYMMVDFTMFEDIIDGLGGVNVEVTEKEAVYMRDIVECACNIHIFLIHRRRSILYDTAKDAR
jgi:LCP family protein required for cell wall assembly